MIHSTDLAKAAHSRFSTWIYEHALPFWSTTGTDPNALGFVEHLDIDGTPASVNYKRVRVQARQIYVFSHASLLGWNGGQDLAAQGFRFLTSHGWNKDGGWARQLGRDGGIVDRTADLYDHAFVLFALAWYARATKSDEAIQWAHKTLSWVQRHMASPHGGFQNAVPIPAEARQQNPHMHMLEATLALYETSGDAHFRSAAEDLFALFQTRLFDAETGTLGEFFNDDWSPAPGPTGSHIEPGHHYEWVWILNQFERLTGQSTRTEAAALYRFANKFGARAESGLIYDVVDRQGNPRETSFRLWPHTEAIKAHVVAAENGLAETDIGPLLSNLVDNLLGHFLHHTPRGTWVDHYHADASLKSDKIPSSSFYHIFMAFGEMDRMMKGSQCPA